MVKILKAFLGKSEGSESFKKKNQIHHSSGLPLKKKGNCDIIILQLKQF